MASVYAMLNNHPPASQLDGDRLHLIFAGIQDGSGMGLVQIPEDADARAHLHCGGKR